MPPLDRVGSTVNRKRTRKLDVHRSYHRENPEKRIHYEREVRLPRVRHSRSSSSYSDFSRRGYTSRYARSPSPVGRYREHRHRPQEHRRDYDRYDSHRQRSPTRHYIPYRYPRETTVSNSARSDRYLREATDQDHQKSDRYPRETTEYSDRDSESYSEHYDASSEFEGEGPEDPGIPPEHVFLEEGDV
ncbi:mRNA cap guanine-N7 methyltransferase-like [Belonocnema kinseyi]|uniref:mRNA cap guanine-N7 methyltransferase-like n=1 Tax=Belonocnema kinseyi TaxID=2817044 RepID=UPI00143DC89E|nr:mRNA cap guanine-N7 methyltransferase-like [Belonocnema kinseyi]